MNQFYESSSLRMCPDGSWCCVIQCARVLHLCVEIEMHYRCLMLLFSVSHSKGSRDHILLFSISYLIKKKKKHYNLPLVFWCTFHFWHLLYMQYPVVLCPKKKQKTKWRAVPCWLNHASLLIWVQNMLRIVLPDRKQTLINLYLLGATFHHWGCDGLWSLCST